MRITRRFVTVSLLTSAAVTLAIAKSNSFPARHRIQELASTELSTQTLPPQNDGYASLTCSGELHFERIGTQSEDWQSPNKISPLRIFGSCD